MGSCCHILGSVANQAPDIAGPVVRPAPEIYLRPTQFIESDSPAVVDFAAEAVGDAADPREKAVRLFYAVRDGIRYDPYTWHTDPRIYKATTTLATRRSFCIPKAILLAATARSHGIPSRLGFADVRNHLATERLLRLMRTDLFVFHGYAELYLGERWIKATPTFNLELCERFGVEPLDWDGVDDATLHPCDREGRRHMEYVRDRGTWADLPLTELEAACREAYPHYFDDQGEISNLPQARDSFEHEAERESSV